MPAVIAHHLFGAEAFAELQTTIGFNGDTLDAFLLGNQGPDPLFCLKALPKSMSFRNIGSVMHIGQPAELLQNLHLRCTNSDDESVWAYASGFICHYLLDTTVHPLVYAQQRALCETETIPPLSGGAIHAAIETEFDEHILQAKLDMTVNDFSPHHETLACTHDALASISEALADVVDDTYGLSIPVGAYAMSVRLYRGAQRAIDSKREGLRRHVDYARLAGKRYPHILALTHSARGQRRAVFTNDDHIPWPHPFEPASVVTSSFDELFESALERAVTLLPRFAQSDFSVNCDELSPLANFCGERPDDN